MLSDLLPDVHRPAKEVATPAFGWLLEFETVSEALARLRREPGSGRTIYFYVTDSKQRLIGVAPMRKLLLADPATLIGELMEHPVCSVQESEAFGSALALLAKHRLLALPMVDADGRLTGTVDISAATRELAARERQEREARFYQTTGVRSGGQRGALLPGLVAGLLLAIVMASFEGLLRRSVEVTFFIPVVLAAAEAAGRRAVAISLEGFGPWARAGVGASGWRMYAAGAVAGGAAAGIVAALWLRRPALACCVGGSVAIAATVGAVLGYCIPRQALRWDLNPRIAPGPIVTMAAEVVALWCYLAASALLL